MSTIILIWGEEGVEIKCKAEYLSMGIYFKTAYLFYENLFGYVSTKYVDVKP